LISNQSARSKTERATNCRARARSSDSRADDTADCSAAKRANPGPLLSCRQTAARATYYGGQQTKTNGDRECAFHVTST
jgi:hypothetical protein